MEIQNKMISLEKEYKTVVIAVLGTKKDNLYSKRILHGIQLAKYYTDFFDSINLIVKWYKDSEWSKKKIKELVKKLKCSKIIFHDDTDTEYFRKGQYSFDTIEEAAMLRISLEKVFKNRKIHLTIVTSELHSKRADFIFNSLFENINYLNIFSSMIIPYNPSLNLVYINYSNNSETEEKEAKQNKEREIYDRQLNESKTFHNFLEYYEKRDITFKGEFDQKGKSELMGILKNKIN